MTEPVLPLSVEQLLHYDHRRFVQTLELNESSENNFQMLMKMTNYCRQIILAHIQAAHNIRAGSILVREKFKYYKDDVNCLKDIEHDSREYSKMLFDKVTKAKEKQRDLTNRTCGVVHNLRRYAKINSMSSAEIKYLQVIEELNGKMNSFNDDLYSINSRLDALTKSDKPHYTKTWYFQEWQMNLVKRTLFCMNNSIQSLLNDIKEVNDTIDDDEKED